MTSITEIAGHIPNYVDPATKQPLLLGINIGFTVLAAICVALRIYTRRILRNIILAEDWVVMIAMTLAIVATTCTCLGCKLGGTGLHYWDIPPTTDLKYGAQFSYVNQFLYQPILQLTKISILLFYTSLAEKSVNYLHKSAFAVLIISAAFCVSCTAVEIFQCNPLRKGVYGPLVAGTCIDQAIFFKNSAYINLILDVVVLVLPLPLLWKLHAPIKQRLILLGIFCVGIFAVICSIIRLAIWYGVAGDGNRNNPDSTWTRVDITNWSCIEYCTTLICSSLPHLKPLLVKVIPAIFTAHGTTENDQYNLASASKRYQIPIGSTDRADTFYGSKKGQTNRVVSGGYSKSVVDKNSDSNSIEAIVGKAIGASASDQGEWTILKTVRVDVDACGRSLHRA